MFDLNVKLYPGAAGRAVALVKKFKKWGSVLQWFEHEDFIVVRLDGDILLCGKDVNELNLKVANLKK